MILLLWASLLLLLAAGTIAYPLCFQALEPHRIAGDGDETDRDGDALLEALSELEDAHGGGKLSEEDYQAEKRQLQRRYLAHAAPAHKNP